MGVAPIAAMIASPSALRLAAGEDEGAGVLVAAPGGVEGGGGGQEPFGVAGVDGVGPVDDRRRDRVVDDDEPRPFDAFVSVGQFGQHGGLGPDGGVPLPPGAVVPRQCLNDSGASASRVSASPSSPRCSATIPSKTWMYAGVSPTAAPPPAASR